MYPCCHPIKLDVYPTMTHYATLPQHLPRTQVLYTHTTLKAEAHTHPLPQPLPVTAVQPPAPAWAPSLLQVTSLFTVLYTAHYCPRPESSYIAERSSAWLMCLYLNGSPPSVLPSESHLSVVTLQIRPSLETMTAFKCPS